MWNKRKWNQINSYKRNRWFWVSVSGWCMCEYKYAHVLNKWTTLGSVVAFQLALQTSICQASCPEGFMRFSCCPFPCLHRSTGIAASLSLLASCDVLGFSSGPILWYKLFTNWAILQTREVGFSAFSSGGLI